MSRMCRLALDHRSFTDSSAVAGLRRTARPGLLFITNLPAGVAVGGPFSFRYQRNREDFARGRRPAAALARNGVMTGDQIARHGTCNPLTRDEQ